MKESEEVCPPTSSTHKDREIENMEPAGLRATYEKKSNMCGKEVSKEIVEKERSPSTSPPP